MAKLAKTTAARSNMPEDEIVASVMHSDRTATFAQSKWTVLLANNAMFDKTWFKAYFTAAPAERGKTRREYLTRHSPTFAKAVENVESLKKRDLGDLASAAKRAVIEGEMRAADQMLTRVLLSVYALVANGARDIKEGPNGSIVANVVIDGTAEEKTWTGRAITSAGEKARDKAFKGDGDGAGAAGSPMSKGNVRKRVAALTLITERAKAIRTANGNPEDDKVMTDEERKAFRAMVSEVVMLEFGITSADDIDAKELREFLFPRPATDDKATGNGKAKAA